MIHLLTHSALQLPLSTCVEYLLPNAQPRLTLNTPLFFTFTSSPYVHWHVLFLHLNKTVLHYHHICTEQQDSSRHAQSCELWDKYTLKGFWFLCAGKRQQNEKMKVLQQFKRQMQHRKRWCQPSNAAPQPAWMAQCLDGRASSWGAGTTWGYLSTSSLRTLCWACWQQLHMVWIQCCLWTECSFLVQLKSSNTGNFIRSKHWHPPGKNLTGISNCLPRGFCAFLSKQLCMWGPHAFTEGPPSFTKREKSNKTYRGGCSQVRKRD